MNDEQCYTDVCPICGSTDKRRPNHFGKIEYQWECMQCGRLYSALGFKRYVEPEEYSYKTRQELIEHIEWLREKLFERDIHITEQTLYYETKIDALEHENKETKDRQDIRLEEMEQDYD